MHVFYIDVAKVDRDVAFVAMVIHVCLKFLIEEWKTHTHCIPHTQDVLRFL